MLRLAISLLAFNAGVTVAIVDNKGPSATLDAMMHMHEEFDDVVDRIFDGPADVLVGTKASF